MATQYWLGAAVPIPEVWTISVEGTWAEGDYAWVQVNGKRLTLTVGSTATIHQVGADLADMINGESANGTETRSALGTSVGEWNEITAAFSESTDNLTLTGPSDGRPCGTITCGYTSSAGIITVDGSTYTTAGTGPHHFDNTANWSQGSVPVDNDDIVFDHQAAASCLYGLTPVSLTPTSLTITSGFRYAIGLPSVNKDTPSLPYDEIQTEYLTIDGATTATIDASGAQNVKIDFGATTSAITVNGTGITSESGVPPMLIKANNASTTLSVTSGSVGFNYEPKVTGQAANVYCGGTTNPTLEIGNTTTIGTAINIAQGTVINRTAVTVPAVNLAKGTFDHHGATVTALNADGGTVNLLSGGTITTLNISKATLDAKKNRTARTITTANVYAGTNLQDPGGSITFTNGINLYCAPTEVTLDLPPRKKYTIAAIT